MPRSTVTASLRRRIRSLFLQETIKRGVLMPSLVVSYSHTDADIDATVEAIDGALEVYARALEDGAERYLDGQTIPSRIPLLQPAGVTLVAIDRSPARFSKRSTRSRVSVRSRNCDRLMPARWRRLPS